LNNSHLYLGRYLALEYFSCLSNKSMALTLFTKFIAVLVSKMEFFCVPAPNASIRFALDFLAHFPLYVLDIPSSIKTWCALAYTAHHLN